MTIDPSGQKKEIWSVQAIRPITVSQWPVRCTSWHATKHEATEHAKRVERRGGKVVSIRGWQEVEYIDWYTRETDDTNTR